MDELIGRLVADVGVDRNAAEESIGIALDSLASEEPADNGKVLVARPGVEALKQRARAEAGVGVFSQFAE